MTAATMSMDLSLAQDQVVSWLNDEETTVTAQKIQQDCVYEQTDGSESGLTRFQGSSLLKQLYETDPSKYVATVVRIQKEEIQDNENENIPVTTFSCVNSNSDLNSDSSTILALAKKSSASQVVSESLESSHETDMAALRDRLFSKNSQVADPSWFYNHSQLSTIQMAPSLGQDENMMPAAPEEKTWHKLEKNGPIVRNNISNKSTAGTAKALKNSSNTSTSTAASTSTKAKPKAVKPTTAQSFFSKKPAAKTTAKPKAAPEKTTKPAASKSTSSSSAFTKRVRPEPNDPDDEQEKEKESTAAASTAAVGNADDFVGDEDEDSDDEQEMEERREKSKEIVRKQKEQDDMLDALQQQEDLDLQEDKPTLVKGAMDAFATKQTKPAASAAAGASNTAGKKRRKVLKEKTTVNAQGFLVTTTEAVWEDVSSDEEDNATAARPSKPTATASSKSNNRPASKLPTKKAKPKGKKPSDMKQGSLMGFFAVKKK